MILRLEGLRQSRGVLECLATTLCPNRICPAFGVILGYLSPDMLATLLALLLALVIPTTEFVFL
ncbi:hypothetical protein DMH12_04215 [Streptomyces sp. WAC 04229]|nr:hypothetical protein DMH12_04215 [Streptomyces sp. WAC 04229]